MSESTNKKPQYSKPTIKKYGSVTEFTRTASHGSKTDGGAAPSNKHMCISASSPLLEHQILLGDHVCQKAFADLIKVHIKPGDVVLDLGTGSGLHTLFACRAGAKKVYAIEFDSIIEKAKEVIAANGYGDRVEFIMGDSVNIQLPEKVDVIVSNLGFMNSVDSLFDARARFLKPSGKMIPDGVYLNFAPIFDAPFYQKMINFWEESPQGFDFSPLKSMATNHPFYFKVQDYNFAAPPVALEEISFLNAERKLYSWKVDFSIDQKMSINGLVGWYDFTFQGSPFISAGPQSKLHPELWSHIFLPLEQPIEVSPSDALKVNLKMSVGSAPDGPIWQWQTALNTHELFDQCTFKAMPMSEKILSKLN